MKKKNTPLENQQPMLNHAVGVVNDEPEPWEKRVKRGLSAMDRVWRF